MAIALMRLEVVTGWFPARARYTSRTPVPACLGTELIECCGPDEPQPLTPIERATATDSDGGDGLGHAFRDLRVRFGVRIGILMV